MTVLAHYDAVKHLVLACDASPYGLESILSYKMEDGSKRPIAFASCSLNDTEKKYQKVDKEGLALVFGTQKFHKYIFGSNITLLTDHKPLLGLLKAEKGIPATTSKMQRYTLKLAAYQYDLQHQERSKHSKADALSPPVHRQKYPEKSF